MKPRDEKDLAEFLCSTDSPVKIVGGGTRPIGRPVDATELSTGALSGTRLYEPAALTIVVSAGEPLVKVEELLAENGQRLPFEPGDYREFLGTVGEPTIGAVAAGNISGPRRIQVGACRDFMIGVRFVDGNGSIISNGGRVMKNVTGYDLVKLIAGSRGTLGVVTEIAFKVLPQVEYEITLSLQGLSDASAIAVLGQALGSPCEVSGAAHLSGTGSPTTLLRLEGFEDSVVHRTELLKRILGEYGEIHVDQDQNNVMATWKGLANVRPFSDAEGDVWRLVTKPDRAVQIVGVLRQQIDAEAIYDWGGGLVWLRVPQGIDCRALLGQFPGHATLVRASDETRHRIRPFSRYGHRLDDIAEDIRRRFDPRNLLNPGIMA